MDKKFFSADDPLMMKLGGEKISDLINDYDYDLKDFAPYILLVQKV